MITVEERNIARHCIEYALSQGANGVRLSLNKNVMDSCSMLNGELDKVSHSADRSIYLYLYVDGKYGTFSTNRLDVKELEDFISKAIVMVKMLGEDPCRRLPDPDRTAKDAAEGMELGLYDSHYEKCDSDLRLAKTEKMSIMNEISAIELPFNPGTFLFPFAILFLSLYLILLDALKMPDTLATVQRTVTSNNAY